MHKLQALNGEMETEIVTVVNSWQKIYKDKAHAMVRRIQSWYFSFWIASANL
jgi:hypothetical protein